MSLLPFWALNVVVALLSMEGQKALGFHQKYLNLCSKGKRKSYGLVINDRIVIFGWTIPLNVDFRKRSWIQFSDVRATLYWTDICIATCIALWVGNTFGNVGVFLVMNPVLSFILFNWFWLNITRVAYLNKINWHKKMSSRAVKSHLHKFHRCEWSKTSHFLRWAHVCAQTADIYSLTRMVICIQSSRTKH